MKSIKKILLSIAMFILAVVGAILYVNNSTFGMILMILTILVGIYFLIDGFLSID